MEKGDIRRFYEHLKENQIPEEVTQEAQGFGSKRYTADMWTLEVCECFLGMECKRMAYANQKYLLLEELEKVKEDANKICIGEVGRGLDIAIANMVREWDVICYDHNPIYQGLLDKYFKGVEYICTSTVDFMENRLASLIKEKTIFIIDNTKCRDFKALEENENIVHLIFYGKLLW